MAHVIKELRF